MQWANLFLIILVALLLRGVYSYNRPPRRQTLFIPHSKDANSDTSPQQVYVFTHKFLEKLYILTLIYVKFCRVYVLYGDEINK